MSWTPHAIATHHVDKIVCPGHPNGPEVAKKYVYKIPEVPSGALRAVQSARDLSIEIEMQRSVPDPFMSKLLGERTVMFEAPYSKRLKVSSTLTLIANINGMSDNGTIVIRDNYVKKMDQKIQEQTEAKLLAALITWGPDRGVYYFENLDKKIELNLNHSYEKWYDSMEKKLIAWSETLD